MREGEPKFEHNESLEDERIIQEIKDFAIQKSADLAAVIGGSGQKLVPLIEKAEIDWVEIPRILDLITDYQQEADKEFNGFS